ncbi:MAG: TerB family tellurite resistance protein [Acidobacteriota bacterium]
MIQFEQSAVIKRYGTLPKEEQVIKYLKALKVIIGADGQIAEAELNALKKGMKRMGAPEDLVRQIEEFDISGVKLESVLPTLTPGGRRARYLLRDAIDISRADGTYAAEEKAAVARAAQLLGVSEEVTRSIEALVELEHAVNHLRKAIFPKS